MKATPPRRAADLSRANDGTDPRNTEHNFGTVTAEREPKPAYLAVKTLSVVLGNARFLRRLEGAARDHLLLFADDDAAWLAAWTEEGERSARIAAPGLDGDVKALTLQGKEVRVKGGGWTHRRRPDAGTGLHPDCPWEPRAETSVDSGTAEGTEPSTPAPEGASRRSR